MAAPLITGSPAALALGTSATPGAQPVTVPADAQIVVVHYRTYSASGSTLSLASSFAGTWTYDQTSGAGEHTGVAWAVVSSTGSQTITPTWTNAPAEGPVFLVSFVKDANTSTPVRDTGQQVFNATGTAASVTLTTATDDLVLALDSQFDAGNAIPANPAGWTSLATQGVNSEGGRLRSADAPGASSTTATGQSTSYSGIAAISLQAAAGGGGGGVDPPSVLPGQPAWAGIYGRGGGRDLVCGAGRLPNSKANASIFANALFGATSAGPTIVTGSQAGAWTVRNLASATRTGAWTVRNPATGSASSAWTVRTSASSTRAGAWSVRNLAAATAGGAWSARNYATGTAAGAWSVTASATIVSSSASGAWTVRNLASGASASAWTVRNLASATRASAWSVRNGIASSTSGAWTVRNGVASSTAGAWTVRNAASATASGAWSVRVLAAATVGASWSVRNRVAGSKAGAWSVLAAGGYPDPADVRYGVQYGPTGTEFTGTMRAGTVWLRRR